MAMFMGGTLFCIKKTARRQHEWESFFFFSFSFVSRFWRQAHFWRYWSTRGGPAAVALLGEPVDGLRAWPGRAPRGLLWQSYFSAGCLHRAMQRGTATRQILSRLAQCTMTPCRLSTPVWAGAREA